MFGTYFYHQTSRKMVVAFGSLFNNIEVRRTDSSNVVVEVIKIPLSYGPKDKMLVRISSDPNLNPKVALTVPRMGFELTSMTYDGARKLNTMNRNVKKGTTGLKKQFHPVPYNWDFSLYIFVKNAEDGTQILEQILPYFTPEFTVTINTIPEMGIKADVPITLNSADVADEYEGELATARTITWTLSFTLRGYVYPDIKTGSIIKTVEVNFRIPGGDEESLETNFIILESTSSSATSSDYILLENDNYEKIMNENSSEGVGDSTVKSRYTVVPSPTTAEASSDFGFSETFEFFEDSKGFNPCLLYTSDAADE